MPRKTARGPSEEPLSRPGTSSTVGSTPRGPYRPSGAPGPDATQPSSFPGGGSGTGRAASVPLTIWFIGTAGPGHERGGKIFYLRGAVAVVEVVGAGAAPGAAAVDVVVPPGDPFFGAFGGGVTTMITPDVPWPLGPPQVFEK